MQGEAKELKEAFVVLDSGVEKVRAFLDSHGFAAGEIALAAINTTVYYARDQHNNPTREITAYALARTFTISSSNVGDRDGGGGGDAAPEGWGDRRLDAPGVFLQPYRRSEGADPGEASKDARARADEIVRNSGGSIGSVRDARMSPLQITRPDSTQVSGEGMYDTSTIDKDVTAVVTITFGVGE